MILMEITFCDERVNARWTQATTSLTAGSNLVIRVSASDGPSTGDIVEAGIDDILITSECDIPVIVTGF